MHDGKEQQTQRIYEYMALLALDLFTRIIAMRIDAGPPFFGAFHALAIDNGGGGAGFSFRLFAACDVRARDECDPAHHRTATKCSGGPCCTAESPLEGSAIGNRCSGYTSPRS